MKTNFLPQPLRRQFQTEVAPGGSGCQLQFPPRLTAKWIVGEDGNLTCEWDKA